jgi:hypothetical protein
MFGGKFKLPVVLILGYLYFTEESEETTPPEGMQWLTWRCPIHRRLTKRGIKRYGSEAQERMSLPRQTAILPF